MSVPAHAADTYDASFARIGALLGAKQLGDNVTAVPPGKRAFPRHSHRVNEEMFLIFQGSGEFRIGDQSYALRAGEVIACPSGGPETAHQIADTGLEELRYLSVSALRTPEICEYPDSGEFGVIVASATSGAATSPAFPHLCPFGAGVSYRNGE